MDHADRGCDTFDLPSPATLIAINRVLGYS